MRDYITDAMHAHTNLNVFASIVEILEGGLLYGGHNKAADRIIALCKAEQQRQLRKMDDALERARAQR